MPVLMSYKRKDNIMEIPEFTLGLGRDGNAVYLSGKEHAADAQVQAWLLDADGKVADIDDPVWEKSYLLAEDWLNGEGELCEDSYGAVDEWCLRQFTLEWRTSAAEPIYDDGEIEPTRIRTVYMLPTGLPGVAYAVEVDITTC